MAVSEVKDCHRLDKIFDISRSLRAMLSTTRNLPADFHTGDEPTITDRLLLSRNLFPFIREEIGFDEMLIEISKSLFFERDI